MCANIHAPKAGDDLYYSSLFLFSSFTLEEMSEWKKKDFSSSYPHSRWQEERERKGENEKRDMIYIFNRRSDCHHVSFIHFDHRLTTSLPGVFFSIDEREKLLGNTRWIEFECARARICSIRCVELCQILFRLMTFHFSVSLSLSPSLSIFLKF